jgi:hypothetical protein
MPQLGKILILFGLIIVAVGVLLMFVDRIPFFGKLPGDVHVKRDDFQFYFPITTSILLSVVLTVILWLISFLGRK